MPDWTRSMEQTYEFYKVNPDTWQDNQRLDNIISCTIKRDSTNETLGSATLNCTSDLKECYVRIYLVTRQDRIKERFVLGTYLAQTPELNYDGRNQNISIDCYSPLLELKDNVPPLGYTTFEGVNTMEAAFTLIYENCRAPVVQAKGMDHTLIQDFTADTNDTWLSYIKDLMAQAEYQFGLEDDCSIYFDRIQDMKAMQPVYTFSDDNSSLLQPSITDKRDLYGVPNILEMVYTTSSKDFYYAYVENKDENSEISTVNRGRKVVKRIDNPTFSGNPTEGEFKQYAIQQLLALSTMEHTVNFTHGFIPWVRLGTCVRLDYKRAGLDNIRARITGQTIKCETGCMVEATATYTTELWNGQVEEGGV